MTVSVRAATIDDLASLVAFNIAMAAESEDKPLDADVLGEGIEAVLTDSAHGVYLVAELDGAVVGALMITYEWSDWRNGRFWWIQSVFVVESQRRQGVYRALHGRARALAKDDPTSCGLRLYVEQDNTGAQTVYRKLGMDETAYRLYEEEWERS